VLVGAGIAIVVLLVAGVAVAATSGGESNDDASERPTAESTLPGSNSGAGGAQFVFASTASMIPTTVANKRYNGLTVDFECTTAGCEPQVLAGLPGMGYLPMTQTGDRFVGEHSYPSGTANWTCSVLAKADVRVLDWQDVGGIRVPARVSVLASNAVDGGFMCDEYDAVFEGSEDVVIEHAVGGG